MWLLLLYVGLAGAVGGVVNALLTDKGFYLPTKEQVEEGITIVRPGWIGNVVIGVVAAVVSWGLYGPFAAFYIAGTSAVTQAGVAPEQIGLTLSSLVGAVLVGVGGARWLTNEVDKSLLKAAATEAATPSASRQIAMASPVEALNIARRMRQPD